MKLLLFSLLLLLSAPASFAQKFAVKGDLVTVDGQPYFRFESDGSSLFYINSLQHAHLFVVKALRLNDPVLNTPTNPGGEQWYLQYVFLQPHTVVELPSHVGLTSLPLPVQIARTLYVTRVLQAGRVDPAALAEFALVNGTLYSDRRQALNQASWLPPAVINSPGLAICCCLYRII
jgi:hypothetical protein